MKYGKQLKQKRIANDLSQQRLARKVGFSQSRLSKLETGILAPTLTDAARFAKALRWPVESQARAFA